MPFLVALHWHFESQCIPTWPAYYAHQLPDFLKKLSVVGTYIIEILTPPLFFMPLKSVRLFSCLAQVCISQKNSFIEVKPLR